MPEADGANSRRSETSQVSHRHDLVKSLLGSLLPPTCMVSSLEAAHCPAQHLQIDWPSLPPPCDPLAAARAVKGRGARPHDEKRFERKRRQVECFAAVVQAMLDDGRLRLGAVVVDFGCGSGNLLLPLAALFPGVNFVGVDIRRQDVEILSRRIAQADLKNATAWQGTIRDYSTSGYELDLALGLHVCGEASDHIIMEAVARGVPWILSPCCIGTINNRADEGGFIAEITLDENEIYAINKASDGSATIEVQDKHVPIFGAQRVLPSGYMGPVVVSFKKEHGFQSTNTKNAKLIQNNPLLHHLMYGCGRACFAAQKDIALMARSGSQLERPRSEWLSHQVDHTMFAELARVADVGHVSTDCQDRIVYHAKTIVTLDRSMWAQERGYNVTLGRIGGMNDYAKDDLLIGDRK